MNNQNTTTKRILVWTTLELKARNGGPSSYLYNLAQLLNQYNFGIDYLPDLINPKVIESNAGATGKVHSVKSFIKKFVPQKIAEKIRIRNSYQLAINNYAKSDWGLAYINLNDYAAIHFHSTLELVRLIPYLENFQGKIILTTHTPCPPFEHELNHLLLNENNISNEEYKEIVRLDFKAFQRADYILIPCLEAVDAYQKGYEKVGDFQKLLSEKEVKFIPTGVPKSEFEKDKETIKQTLNIPEEALVIHYSGRHNQEKGYDLLVDFGKQILEQYPDTYFLITGKPTDNIPYPNHPRWIEIGWTTDPFSYANAADLFILPNRVSYFDLVLIEMLALNLPILISKIGGNMYFYQNREELDAYFFESENLDDMLSAFNDFYKHHKKSNKNQSFYERHLAVKAMAEGYRSFYSEILQNK
jgi:glycosyltransferase involved in cell wall biosynthesis